ncbi:unnamed protein product [Closterium sp. NIES-54]
MARHLHKVRSVPDVHNLFLSAGLDTPDDTRRPDDQLRTQKGPRHRHQHSDGFILDSQRATFHHSPSNNRDSSAALSPVDEHAGSRRSAGDSDWSPLPRSPLFVHGRPTGLPPRRHNSFHTLAAADPRNPAVARASAAAVPAAPGGTSNSSSQHRVFSSITDPSSFSSSSSSSSSSDDDDAAAPQDMFDGARVSQTAGYPPRQCYQQSGTGAESTSYFYKQQGSNVDVRTEPLKAATEAVLRSRVQEVLSERHEFVQQLSSFRVTAAYRQKRVEATVKEAEVLKTKLAGGEKRLERVRAQLDATRIARDAAARELAVLRRIAPATDAGTSDDEDSDESDASDSGSDATSDRGGGGARSRGRGGMRLKAVKPAGDAAWRKAELRNVLQEMAQALEKSEKRARSALARTMQLEGLLEDRKEELAEVRKELRTAEGERNMLADELQEAFNSWAQPCAPAGNATRMSGVASAPLLLQPLQPLEALQAKQAQRATDRHGVGTWMDEGRDAEDYISRGAKGGSRETGRISRSTRKEELGTRMRARGMSGEGKSARGMMSGRGSVEELGGVALPCNYSHCLPAPPARRALLQPARRTLLLRASRPAAACTSRLAALRVAPYCSQRVAPCCSQRVGPNCSQRVALCCPSRRALLQPARRALLQPARRALLPHTSRPAALHSARPAALSTARPARPSRAAQPEPSCPTRAAPPYLDHQPHRAALLPLLLLLLLLVLLLGAAGSAGSAAGVGGAGGATGSAGGAAGAGRATGSAGGAAGAGATRGGQRRSLPLPDEPTPQQLREWVLQRARPGGGGFGFLRTAQRRLQSQHETFSLQVLSELFPERCVTGSVEVAALGASESAATLGASESATALGARESAAALGARASPATGPSSAEALHTFTLDSGASRCFFRDCTILTPLAAPVPVSLADPTGGPVVARASTVLPCPAVPSGSLTGLHLPTFSTNLVSNTAIQDVWVDTFIPGGQRVAICTCYRTGRHLATFTRRLGSSLYTPTTASAQVAEAGQVAESSQVSAPGQLSASCSCRVLSHQTLLWHHRLGHPSLLRLCGMHSRLLVSGLPRSLPSLRRSLAPPCLLCVEGRQRAAPHSFEFPPTTTPLQTLHMDVWGPAPVGGTDQERYFLLVVDDYTRYTTIFPLRRKADVSGVLIPWIRATCRHLRERFSRDFPVLRLHSDRGGEFSSDLLAEFCQNEGIVKSFMLPASPHQNGIAEHRIGLIMEVSGTSMIHAAAPHFLWPVAFRYIAHQLNLWPRVSEPETLPTLWWTGKVGDASVFWVWGALSLVRDAKASKLSSRTLRCVFLGFPTDATPWQFYHPRSRRVFSSHDVTFDESVCYYRLHPHASHPGPAPSAEGGDPAADDTAATRRSPRLETPPGFPPQPSLLPPQPAAVDSGAETTGAEPGGAEIDGADSRGAATGGAGSEGVAREGAGSLWCCDWGC